jgi:cytolysin-activating lysine-acyltransferase
MPRNELHLICPQVRRTEKSEAELFGAMVWLWMHSETHRQCPLHELERLLLPALKTGQFVLALQNNELQQPAGLMTWANFDAAAERRYLQSLDRTMQPTDWQCGDRPWILDWVVPFGHVQAMTRATQRLLPQALWRGLYHKGDATGLKVMYFKGTKVLKAQETHFWASRTLQYEPK